MGYSRNTSSSRPCKDCGTEIEWRPTNDGTLNSRGDPKQLPYEIATGQRHRCQAYLDKMRRDYRNAPNAEKAKGIPCKFGCGHRLMWSQDQVSASGKMIPLEMTGEPHQCPNKQQDTRGGGGGGRQYTRGTGPYPSSYRQQQQQGKNDDNDYRNQLTLNNQQRPPSEEGDY